MIPEDDGRVTCHVFTFRLPPHPEELADWIGQHAPDATVRPGGGVQVLIADRDAAFYFALVWRGRYDASYHPDDRTHPPPS